jgi:hypothetical protein
MTNHLSLTRPLTSFFAIAVVLIGSFACSAPKVAQSLPGQPEDAWLSDVHSGSAPELTVAAEAPAQDLLASSETEPAVAAAATRTGTDGFMAPAYAAGRTQTAASEAGQVARQLSEVRQQLASQPAPRGIKNKLAAAATKTMLKKAEKKAERLTPKDIKDSKTAKRVNNRTLLIIGIVLAVVGLLLVIFGQPTGLIILGAAASLASLILLLLALL